MDRFIKESEAGGAEMTVACCVDFSHQHVVQAWERDGARKIMSQYVKYHIQFVIRHLVLLVYYLRDCL